MCPSLRAFGESRYRGCVPFAQARTLRLAVGTRTWVAGSRVQIRASAPRSPTPAPLSRPALRQWVPGLAPPPARSVHPASSPPRAARAGARSTFFVCSSSAPPARHVPRPTRPMRAANEVRRRRAGPWVLSAPRPPVGCALHPSPGAGPAGLRGGAARGEVPRRQADRRLQGLASRPARAVLGPEPPPPPPPDSRPDPGSAPGDDGREESKSSEPGDPDGD